VALEETLDIVVTDDGMDAAIAKAEALERALDGARRAAEEMDLAGGGAGDGLDGALAKAKALEEELKSARDAGGELDAVGAGAGAGLDAGAASAAALSKELGSARDKAVELDGALGVSDGGLAGAVAEAAALAEAEARVRDNAVEAAAAQKVMGGGWREGIGSVDYSAAAAEMDKLGRKEAEVAIDAEAMKQEIRAAGIDSAASVGPAMTAMEAYGNRIKAARDAIAELAGAVAASDAAFGGGAGTVLADAAAYDRLRDKAVEAAAAVTAAAAAQTASDVAGAGGGTGGMASKLAMAPGDLVAFGVGAGVIVPAIAAATTEAVALAAGITAATAGVGAFAALAVPSVEKVKTAYSNLTGAQTAYHQAQQLEARDPTKSNLEAQATALAKLGIAQAAFNKLNPNEQGAVRGIEALKHSYLGMAKAFEPDAFKVFNKGLHLANTLLPHLSPFAKTAANALGSLLGRAGKFTESSGFKDWLKQFHSLEGPSIKAIGSGLGLVANEFGKLMTTMSGKDVAHGITTFFEALRVGMDGLGTISAKSMQTVDDISSFVGHFTHWTAEASGAAAKFFNGDRPGLSRVMAANVASSTSRFLNKPITVHPPIRVDPRVSMPSDTVSKLQAQILAQFNGAKGSGTSREVRLGVHIDPGDVKNAVQSVSTAKVSATAELTKVDASHIQSAASRVKIHGATVDLSNAKLAGLSALSGTMAAAGRDAGKAFSTAVGAGIESGGAAATSDARGIAQSVRGALSGLGGAGRSDGEALGAGMAAGIEASTGEAVAAAHAMASAVEAAAKVHLGISSPSKVFKKIGEQTVAGYVLGLEGGKAAIAAAMALITGHKAFKDSAITDTIKKLRADVAKAFKDHQVDKSQDTQLTGWIRADNRRLMGLAKQRADIEKEIRAAEAMAKSVASSARQGGSIATLQGAMPAGSVSAAGLEQGMETQLSAIKKFKTEIAQLKKEGASKSVIKQIAQEGVTQGGAAAQALLAGGKGAIAKISQLQHQIAQAAKGLGKTAANASYESGGQIGKGVAAGLKSELSGVEAAIKAMAKKLVDVFKKEMKIHSPSGVMIPLGAALPAGVAVGVDQGASSAAAAMRRLGKTTVGAFHPDPIHAAASNGSSHPGSGGPTHVVIHNVMTLDGREVSRSMQTYHLEHARRNVATGLKLPNRNA
jgi:hypothetical protein